MDKIYLVVAEYVTDVCNREEDIFPCANKKAAKTKFDELVTADKKVNEEDGYLEVQTDEEDLYEAYPDDCYDNDRTVIRLVEKEILN